MRDPEAWTKNLAQRLRREMTNAEVVLWSQLRRNGVPGLRFRRQHPIGPFVADFACVSSKIVVEVDGTNHFGDAQLLHDKQRDAYIRRRGWRVIRVSNEDVYKRLDQVLDFIFRSAPPPLPSAAPPPQAGEER